MTLAFSACGLVETKSTGGSNRVLKKPTPRHRNRLWPLLPHPPSPSPQTEQPSHFSGLAESGEDVRCIDDAFETPTDGGGPRRATGALSGVSAEVGDPTHGLRQGDGTGVGHDFVASFFLVLEEE